MFDVLRVLADYINSLPTFEKIITIAITPLCIMWIFDLIMIPIRLSRMERTLNAIFEELLEHGQLQDKLLFTLIIYAEEKVKGFSDILSNTYKEMLSDIRNIDRGE